MTGWTPRLRGGGDPEDNDPGPGPREIADRILARGRMSRRTSSTVQPMTDTDGHEITYTTHSEEWTHE